MSEMRTYSMTATITILGPHEPDEFTALNALEDLLAVHNDDDPPTFEDDGEDFVIIRVESVDVR